MCVFKMPGVKSWTGTRTQLLNLLPVESCTHHPVYVEYRLVY